MCMRPENITFSPLVVILVIKDGRNVDEFIEELEIVLLVRNQTPEDQADFVLSLLKGAAVEEVRLRKEGQFLRSEYFR